MNNTISLWSAMRSRLIPLVCLTTILLYDRANAAVISSSVHATVILGLQGVSKNSGGELSIQDDAFVFRRSEGPLVRIPIGSIDRVILTQEDKQVGGTPVALGRAATPFGGGRVIALFAHKKYDFLTVEYRGGRGELHGVICQLNKGQGQALADEMEKMGAHIEREVSHEGK